LGPINDTEKWGQSPFFRLMDRKKGDCPHFSQALRRAGSVLVAIILCSFAVVIVRTAWVSDDAYISFRTVDNLLHGYGPRWNVAERVQSYTHPLWMLMLAGVTGVFGNIYLSSLGLSFALTLFAAGLIVKHLRHQLSLVLLAGLTMLLSKAFVDYATSGLENALSHALLATLMVVSANGIRTRGGAFRLGMLVALVGLTRMDLLVLAGPIALSSLVLPETVRSGFSAGADSSSSTPNLQLPTPNERASRRSHLGSWELGVGSYQPHVISAIGRVRRLLLPFAVGVWPLLAWEIFSVVYYGVPFPNTAYAKLHTGIPIGASLTQGVSYFLDSLNRDPLTLFTLVSVPAAAVATRSVRAFAASGAVALYLLYVLRIGGDFMSGRFFTAPLVVCLCALPSIDWPRAPLLRAIPVLAALALGLGAPDLALQSGTEYPEGIHATVFPITGVADERAFYFDRTGFLGAGGLRREADVEDMMRRLDARRQGESNVYIYDTIGMPGFYAGPERHIVDVWALSDPLLARLPAQPKWRIGHYTRTVPEGYIESLIEDRNLIADPAIARLYDRVRLLTRGPLWSSARWRAIACENVGAFCP
jgi:arabinofuranosyltransferase